MALRREPNYVLKGALVVMSGALAAFGVMGWAHAARAFDAYGKADWALLDPLWPIYALGALACGAAQIIAACAAVNFDRLPHTWGNWIPWKALALGFYAVAALFAAYSADMGGQVVLGAGHRAAVEQRDKQRTELTAEVTRLDGVIRTARESIPDPRTRTNRQRADDMAIFERTTETERARLPAARAELTALPALSPDRAPGDIDHLVFLVFILWGLLEPWGYALAERGRVPKPSPTASLVEPQPIPWRPTVVAAISPSTPTKRPPWWSRVWRRVAALVAFSVASTQVLPDAHAQPAMVQEPARSPDIRPSTTTMADRAAELIQIMGERRVAQRLSELSGQPVTRHRVRELLGRNAA